MSGLRIWAFSLIGPLFLLTPSFALDIPQDCIVKNAPPGYCLFCCLESLDKVHGINKLSGLVQERVKLKTDIVDGQSVPSNRGYWQVADRLFRERQIRSVHQSLGNKDETILRYAEKYGVVVVIDLVPCENKDGSIRLVKEYHAIILTKIDEKKFEYYDTNDLKRWVGSREFFNSVWTGESWCIFRDDH